MPATMVDLAPTRALHRCRSGLPSGQVRFQVSSSLCQNSATIESCQDCVAGCAVGPDHVDEGQF